MEYTGPEVIQKIKVLNLPTSKYIVLGGSVLAVRGIRETKDIDVLVLPEVFAQLSQEGWQLDPEYERKWNRKRLRKEDYEVYPDLYLESEERFIDVQELIASADVIEDIPFQPLEHLLVAKREGHREKDVSDVKLIEEYLRKSMGRQSGIR
jgi:predicted nucleotidyltransferase